MKPMLTDTEKQQIPTVEPGANKQWQLFFDNVEIENDRVIGGETAGLKAAFDGLNPERIMGAAVCNGTARREARVSNGLSDLPGQRQPRSCRARPSPNVLYAPRRLSGYCDCRAA